MIIHAPANIQFTLANSLVAQLAPLGNTEDFHGSNPNFRIIKQNKNYSSLSCCSLHLRLDENCAAMPLWLLFGLSTLCVRASRAVKELSCYEQLRLGSTKNLFIFALLANKPSCLGLGSSIKQAKL